MFESNRNLFLGIDIGASSLKIALVSKEKDGRIRLLKSAYEIYENFYDEVIHDPSRAVAYFLKKFLNKEKGLNKVRVGISIAGQSAFVRMTSIPISVPSKLRQIVLYETQQQIPFPIKDVVWDFQIYDRVKKQLNVLVAALKRELVEPVIAIAEGCNLDVEFIDVSNLALYNCLNYFFRDLQQTLILDIGAKTTNIIIINAGKIWTRSLPIGGEDITEAVARELKVDRKKAESLKIEKGKVLMLYFGQQSSSSADEQKIAEAITVVLTDLTNEIVKTLNFYKLQHMADMNFEKVLLTGGVTKTDNIDKFFENSLSLPAQKINYFNFLNSHSQVDLEHNEFLGAAIGLGLRGNGRSVLNINLLPAEQIAVRNFRKKRLPILISCVLVFLTGLILNIFALNKCASYDQFLYKLKNMGKSYEQNQEVFKQADVRVSENKKLVSAISQVFTDKYYGVYILEVIATAMPEKIWLKSLKADLVEYKLFLSGNCSADISDIEVFQRRLEENFLVKKVNIDTVNKGEGNIINFSFTVFLNLEKNS
ncbi:MAG: type IV pilus assembly protein PilM [Candidatus Omnitrophica bacterium]|nr:type IV pilus assembly protein PilM [Candidatus Omnitrophota bacterium]